MSPSTRRAALRIAAKVALASGAIGCGGAAISDEQTGSEPGPSAPALGTAPPPGARPPGPASGGLHRFDPPPGDPATSDAGGSDARVAIDGGSPEPIEPQICNTWEPYVECCANAVVREIEAGNWTLGEPYAACCETLVALDDPWSQTNVSTAIGPCCELTGYPQGPACTPWGPPMPPSMPAEFAALVIA